MLCILYLIILENKVLIPIESFKKYIFQRKDNKTRKLQNNLINVFPIFDHNNHKFLALKPWLQLNILMRL